MKKTIRLSACVLTAAVFMMLCACAGSTFKVHESDRLIKVIAEDALYDNITIGAVSTSYANDKIQKIQIPLTYSTRSAWATLAYMQKYPIGYRVEWFDAAGFHLATQKSAKEGNTEKYLVRTLVYGEPDYILITPPAGIDPAVCKIYLKKL